MAGKGPVPKSFKAYLAAKPSAEGLALEASEPTTTTNKPSSKVTTAAAAEEEKIRESQISIMND